MSEFIFHLSYKILLDEKPSQAETFAEAHFIVLECFMEKSVNKKETNGESATLILIVPPYLELHGALDEPYNSGSKVAVLLPVGDHVISDLWNSLSDILSYPGLL